MREVVLGFDFGGTKVVVAAADHTGLVIAREDFQTKDFIHGQQVLQHAINRGQLLLTQMDSTHTLTAVGVSTMGLTLPDGVIMAPNVPGWAELRLHDTFQAAYPNVQIVIENDVKAATVAELRLGELKGTESGMFLNLGTGIAIGYTLGDKLLRGSHGAAGEVGYALLTPSDPKGYHNGVAPFEEFSGGGGLGRRATEQFGRLLSTKDVFELSGDDADARRFLNEALDVIAFQITNAVIAYDPEKVVIGGGMMASKDIILTRLEDFFQRFVPFPPVLTAAHFRSDAGIHGALVLAMDTEPNSHVAFIRSQ